MNQGGRDLGSLSPDFADAPLLGLYSTYPYDPGRALRRKIKKGARGCHGGECDWKPYGGMRPLR